MADPINFDQRTCPICRTGDFSIRSLEHLEGSCGLNVFGPDELDWDGSTDINWSTQRTEFFYCAACMTRLPDDWQEAIEKALERNLTNI